MSSLLSRPRTSGFLMSLSPVCNWLYIDMICHPPARHRDFRICIVSTSAYPSCDLQVIVGSQGASGRVRNGCSAGFCMAYTEIPSKSRFRCLELSKYSTNIQHKLQVSHVSYSSFVAWITQLMSKTIFVMLLGNCIVCNMDFAVPVEVFGDSIPAQSNSTRRQLD